MVLGILKRCSSYSFYPIVAKLYEDIYWSPWWKQARPPAISFFFFWQIGQVLKMLQHFTILTCASMGKSLDVQYIENG